VGGFSYSEGLEAAIDHGLVHNEASCTQWLLDQLLLTQARGDMAAMAQAVPAWQTLDTERLRALNAWVLATRESSEMRLQTEQMGRSLLLWLQQRQWAAADDVQHCDTLGATHPMVMGLALACTGADLREALMAQAFAWCENLTQAAIKAVPLGRQQAQEVLAHLAEHIAAAVDEALQRDDAHRQSFSPMLAILSARHETQYSRLFRS